MQNYQEPPQIKSFREGMKGSPTHDIATLMAQVTQKAEDLGLEKKPPQQMSTQDDMQYQSPNLPEYRSPFGDNPPKTPDVSHLGPQFKDMDYITSPGEISANFKAEEFASKGDGSIKIAPKLVYRLQQLRDYLGVPIRITSGYRDPAHNKRVGGASSSRHMSGEAADIVADGVSLEELANAAKLFFGDGGIGSSYDSHVHVDVGPTRTW